MARPRVFISSTYYDLKYLRSTIENFVGSLGFDAVLSEKGRIAFSPDIPLDESCYREAAACDIFVLIVGGRFGSERAGRPLKELPKNFYDRYSSITQQEYRIAAERGIPIYILVERAVYAEYETFARNRSRTDIEYAHVDSVNTFHLLGEILAQPRNNPLQQFDRYADIEGWLREQWAGLFRELLHRMQTQAQLAGLQAEVAALAEVNKTLKAYLEEIMSRVAPDQSRQLIDAETSRLANAELETIIRRNPVGLFLLELGLAGFDVRHLAESVDTPEQLLHGAAYIAKDPSIIHSRPTWSEPNIKDVVQSLWIRLRRDLGVAPSLDVATAPRTNLTSKRRGRKAMKTE